LCGSVAELVAHAEVLVFGAPGADAEQALAASRDDQILIDLTRGGICPWGGRSWESAVSIAS
jgi:hypothetical protein